MDRHKIGTVVLTVEPDEVADDWTPEALASRKWCVTGTIVDTHDSHGLTYEVRHDFDGSIGHYEHHELRVVNPVV